MYVCILQISTEFVTSVVVGDDIIPRLSLNAYIQLRGRMKKALLACKLPKHTVLAKGLCNCLSPQNWKDQLRIDPAVVQADHNEIFEEMNYGTDDFHADWTLMLPPGKIIHMTFVNGNVNMCFKDPRDFSDILVSTQMINHHSPSSYQKVLLAANQRFRSNNGSLSEISQNNPTV